MAMDDLEPRPKPQDFASADLSRLSIADLKQRIQDLHAEIARTESVLAAKAAHLNAAGALFGKKP
jgi:uncharacterized small protein (DUF1192 family)